MSQNIIVWFRQDLRLNDNPALQCALGGNNAVIPVFIDDENCGRQAGTMGLWWRNKSLAKLDASLKKRGNRLIYRKGRAADVLSALAKEVNARAVYWNRQYEADIVARDTAIKSELKDGGIDAESFNGSLLFEPWEVTSKSTGGPFKVFTPFWRACCALGLKRGLWNVPDKITAPAQWPESNALPDTAALAHMNNLNIWQPGEDGAGDALALFLTQNISGYAERRNLPAEPATSRLSPHLRWGEISPARIVAETEAANIKTDDGTKFLSELGWREFSYQLLYHNPNLAETCLQNKFEAFPWRNDADAFEAWKHGETGYPIVDAGMRELRRTGYMHNRVRMIAASFLIKHLLIDWREGEKWFWECLVDADPANNSASWQWVAGCGADAAPYFRIFNPILQGPKFDADGIYTKTYVPELSALSGKTLYAPWTAKSDMLDSGAISLGDTYPNPIVNHEAARARALESFKSL
ncbi:MAG: Deoxyribodipyrimidine photo-lyase [Alphaproteobacteria bacterium]|nr:MAG: Deoxyribodipyrimidine photo-lyase [Alphaproteobacteria bacterium]